MASGRELGASLALMFLGTVAADISLVKTGEARQFTAAWPVIYGAAGVSLLVALGRALRVHINQKVTVATPSGIRHDAASSSCNLR
jgi:hypothetical protein